MSKMTIRILLTLALFLATPAMGAPILFGGDVTLNYHIRPDQKVFFTKRAADFIDRADLFIWNAEFSGNSRQKKEKRFVFSGPIPDLSGIAFKNGVAMVTNNHSLDGGEEGFGNLMKQLSKAGIPVSGKKHPVSSRNVLTFESDGRRFHILSASPMIADNRLTSSYTDVVKSLKALKRAPGDYVIVNLHEGVEGTKQISEGQRKRAAELASLGADIISFTHTHTYIDPERIGDSLVLWGLGNFIFGGNSGWKNRDDVRMLEVDPDTRAWRWVKGRTRNYVFDLE